MPSEKSQPSKITYYDDSIYIIIFKIEVYLIYNVVFQVYSKVIKLYIYIYVCIFFFRFFSIKGYYKILIILPCTNCCLSILYIAVCVNSKLLIYAPHFGNHR